MQQKNSNVGSCCNVEATPERAMLAGTKKRGVNYLIPTAGVNRAFTNVITWKVGS